MTSPHADLPPLQPIPVPDDFPVAWNSPEEQFLLWEREQLHFPKPCTPLVADLVIQVLRDGLGQHLKNMGAPLRGVSARRINTYIYQAALVDPGMLDGAEERMKQSVAAHGFTMYQRWLDELGPQIDEINRQLLEMDPASQADDEFRDTFDWFLNAFARAWDIHFTLLPGFYTAPAFKQACAEMFGFTGLEAYEMMQGRPNMSVISGSELWKLAQGAPPAVKAVIAGSPSAEALAALQESDEGRAWLQGFHAYLHEYGWRTGTFELSEPSWMERPELALDNVRLMLRVRTDPAEDQRRGAERAEALADECRAKLAGNPEALGQFEFLLNVARDYPCLQENHNFHLDQKLFALMRRPLTDLGRRLARDGVVDNPDDMAMLHMAEVQAYLAGDHTPRQAEVRQRRAEMEHFAGVTPPLALGSLPPGDNPDPFLADFFGRARVEPAPEKSLKGTPSSRGKATGRARVLTTLAEADRVDEGDILVCEMTTPAWTPLFASLAAIVSDSGGPLSHCAVVAREYGVPCVTGTRIATRTIADGALIEVDGDSGLVRILE